MNHASIIILQFGAIHQIGRVDPFSGTHLALWRSAPLISFAGGIHYYRNLDENWRLMQPYRDARIECPVLFLVGSADSVIRGASEKQLSRRMAPRVPDLSIVMLPGIGHWIQSEAAAEVNAALVRFAGPASSLPRV